MLIERRYCERQPVHLDVAIRYRDQRPLPATARNLSQEGMLLSLGPAVFPRGTLLDLEFAHRGYKWRFPALVVHRSSRGMGVMFPDFQPELYRSLAVAANSPYDTGQPAPSEAAQAVPRSKMS